MPPAKNRDSWIVIEALGPIILDNVEGCIVEIGAGVSSTVLCDLAKQFNRKFYCCDPKPRKTDPLVEAQCCDDLIIFQGTSWKFMKVFDDSIALILIDGEHMYSTVEQEVKFFLPKLVVGGVMFIHDTLPPRPKAIYKFNAGDVYLARQDLERRKDLYTFTWPYTAANFGLTMVMKKEENAPWYRS